jgi:hypothetical protein
MTDQDRRHDDRCWGAAIVMLLLTAFLYWTLATTLDHTHNMRPFEDLTIAPIILVIPLTMAACRYSKLCQPKSVSVYLLAFALPFCLFFCSIVGLRITQDNLGYEWWRVGYWGAPTLFTGLGVGLCFYRCRKKPSEQLPESP